MRHRPAWVAVLAWLSGPAIGVTVDYTINATGTGPKVSQTTTTFALKGGSVCEACTSQIGPDTGCGATSNMVDDSPQGEGCFTGGFFGGRLNAPDMAPGPLTANWSFGGVTADVIVLVPGAPTSCGTAALSGSVSVVIPPVGVTHDAFVGKRIAGIVGGTCTCAAPAQYCVSDPAVSDLVTFQYNHFDPHAPWTCEDAPGKKDVLVDGQWHFIVRSTCNAPDNNTIWTGNVTVDSTNGTAQIEGFRMVADGAFPDQNLPGPDLWVKIKAQCSPCKDGSPAQSQGEDCGNPCGGDYLGNSTTYKIGGAGCLLTCLAMIKQTDPCSENNYGKAVGAFVKGKGALDLKGAAQWALLKYESLPASTSQAEIMKIICEGGHVIAEVPHGLNHHFVLITGEESSGGNSKCHLKINDPACNETKSFLDEYPPVVSYRRLWK